MESDKITMQEQSHHPVEDVNDPLALAVVIMPHSVSIIQCLCNISKRLRIKIGKEALFTLWRSSMKYGMEQNLLEWEPE